MTFVCIPRTLLAPPGGHRRRPAIASKFPKTGFEPRWQGPSERPQGIWDLANKNTATKDCLEAPKVQ